MAIPREAVAIAAVALSGAACAAFVTLRHYEPPPPEGDAEAPEPVFEAAVFFLFTAALFAAVGYGIGYVGARGTVGRVLTLLLTPLGFTSAWATYTGRLGADADQTPRLMGTVSSTVIGAYPVVFDVLSLV